MSTTIVRSDPFPQTAPGRPGRSLLAGLWRGFKGTVVFLLVTFHLGAWIIRNPLDLWDKPIKGWLEEKPWWKEHEKAFDRVDRFTYRYLNLVGCEQGWSMFTPPMARKAPFLACRFEFTDGSSEEVRTWREPDDLASFFRVGGWQLRKHEDYLCYPPKDLETDPERSLWEAGARRAVLDWKARHLDDSRKIRRVVLVCRTIDFPGPDEQPGAYLPATPSDIASFDEQGRLMP